MKKKYNVSKTSTSTDEVVVPATDEVIVPMSESVNSIKLNEEEQKAIRDLDQAMIQKKIFLADLRLQYKERDEAVLNELKSLLQSQFEIANNALKAQGVDLNDKDAGNWHLDVETMTFVKK